MRSIVAAEQWWDVVRNQFRSGGSTPDLLKALGVAVGFVALIVVIQRIQARGAAQQAENDPTKLYRAVVKKLRIGVTQRDLMRRMARDLSIEHPTTLLLCPSLFHDCTTQWLKKQSQLGEKVSDEHVKELESLSAYLFGSARITSAAAQRS